MSIAIHRGTGHVAGHHRPAVGGDLGIEALAMFPRYPHTDPGPRRAIVARAEPVLRAGAAPGDAATGRLVALMSLGFMMEDHVVEKQDRRAARDRMSAVHAEQIATGAPAPVAIFQTVQALIDGDASDQTGSIEDSAAPTRSASSWTACSRAGSATPRESA